MNGQSEEHDACSPSLTGILWAACLTGLFAIVEIVGGVYCGSLSLLADAGYMFVDTLALATAWISLTRIDRDNSNREARNGSLRELLFGMIAGIILLLAGLTIVGVAVARFTQEGLLIGGKLMFWIGMVGLLVNFISFRIVSSSRLNDPCAIEAMRHVVNDIVGSVAVIIAAVAIVFGTAHFVYVDLILAIAFAMLMLFNGVMSFVGNAGDLANVEEVSR